MAAPVLPATRAVSDERDQLVTADEPLASLQLHCGGTLPGTIAVPELLAAVRKARRNGIKIAGFIAAQDESNMIRAWVDVEPRGQGAGCDIACREWQTTALSADQQTSLDRLATRLDGAAAELVAWLDAEQRVLAVHTDSPDLQEVAQAMMSGFGKRWTDFWAVEGGDPGQPLHWRLLDGAAVMLPRSDGSWRARLVPRPGPGGEPSGFELRLMAQAPAIDPDAGEIEAASQAASLGRLVGRDIAPVLRQPVSRIIANAETIRTRLAGPLPEEYAGYAADIATAGKHLLALLDDMGDMEVVEADDFAPVPDRIDLAEVARQAAGILGMRAREKDISVDVVAQSTAVPAVAEFRRVLQVLLNLIGNAIRYSAAGSAISIELAQGAGLARATVCDQGPGLNAAEQARVFDKFERLGRSGDGGSGLGLYISRRLARAMGGDLTVISLPGEGARFTLELPAAE